ncbi:D-alpha,beta-D-heptose 1,7-bisphosphate phosphatase [Stella humosa]|uniref:D,D-heptose 1,7-bisphosphate phosphatase n=1 Tax=Stella humosa TaxID=94 RepID=A0A3N1LK44_9PROT|nr:HAD-IIIA family hydrolase [Stella humosa]ROP91364.1 D-alpha,beta-D-heptose 1,7-bisphosphate phosphatase [Stella humosa]BBK34276.1 D,D-heptose 1,7-bisphosphate phosphatase [Stella humosa]
MRLILIDRDGVLNVDRPDSVRNPGELVPIPGSAAAVARLNAAGVRVAVVTNQAVVGRGIIGPDMLEQIHHRLADDLRRAGARIDAWFVCTDAPHAATARRKPGPGMLREAMDQFRIAPAETVMIGDAETDLEAALAAGCRRVLVRTGKGAATQARGIKPHLLPVAVHEDLAGAVEALLAPA